MNCPHCSTSLRVMEPAPASLLHQHVWIACPVKSCARDILCAIRWLDGFEITPVAANEERRRAWREVGRAQTVDCVVVIGAILVTFAVTMFLALLAPQPTDTRYVLTIAGWGIAIALVLGGGFAMDLAIGVRGWLRHRPRPQLNVIPEPTTYR